MTGLFLIAQIAGRTVAIETDQVASVVDIGTIVAVPGAEPSIRGLTALRSRVVTVICTCVALGLGKPDDIAPQGGRAIITRLDGHHYAILVDALEDVAQFEPLPLSAGLALDDGWRRAALGLVERDGEPILVLDLAVLIPVPLSVAA